MSYIRKRISCVFRGHDLRHVRNIYGDEIIESGMNRSLWRCEKCGAMALQPFLVEGK